MVFKISKREKKTIAFVWLEIFAITMIDWNLLTYEMEIFFFIEFVGKWEKSRLFEWCFFFAITI